MKIEKLTLQYYQFNKIPKIGNHSFKFGWSIHEVINRQCGFKTDRKHHNDIQYLGLLYSNYKKGYYTRLEFLEKLEKRQFIKKYLKHFTDNACNH